MPKISKKNTRDDTAESTRLDQSAWLRAAATAIAEDGFNGTRILPLSKRLGVTRGSFYWHFADHAAFIDAFILYWRDQQLRTIDVYEHDNMDAVSAYRKLLNIVLMDTAPEQQRLKVEFALRGFARRNQTAADAIDVVDRARIKLFLPIVQGIARNKKEAEALALLLLIQISGAQHAIAGPNCNVDVVSTLKQAMLDSLAAMVRERSTTPVL